MSKAEKRAKERYWLEPSNIETQGKYAAYVEGYRQAEKDNELTSKDISTIYSLMINAVFELRSENPSFKGEDIYQEVLKRFKERKEE